VDIKALTENYKSMEELQIFCESQFRQILTLSKKIKELEEKNAELNKKVKEGSSLSLVSSVQQSLPTAVKSLGIKDDAKVIAEVQLNRLKQESFERELTLDETKRVEIFNRIANAPEEKSKPIKVDAKTINTDDLLSLIENDNGTKEK